ncbi:MAG: hypothetical protein GEU71_17900 [Actinobacteria bacterium]|nr:hypothetical protein [Actinomycetota bacterium]
MRRRKVMIAVVATALLITPLAAWAGDRFADVPDSNIFHDDIGWLADSGVTFGCNPPANTEFCPSDNVTREQMAAFMRRLAEGQVVDAATALEADHAATADDADTLDGKDSTAYTTLWATTAGAFDEGTSIGSLAAGAPFEADSVEITALDDGALLLTANTGWETGSANAWPVQWLEVDTGTPCNSFTDGDAVDGTEVEESPNQRGSSLSSLGVLPASAGTHTVSLCLWMFAGNSNSISHSLVAQWNEADNVVVTSTASGGSPQKGEPGTPTGE